MNRTELFFDQLMNPDAAKKALQAYLAANDVKIDATKSLGDIQLYDQALVAAGTEQITFFKGTPAAAATNMTGQYERSQGEHMVMEGIRLYDGVNAALLSTNWAAGINIDEFKQGYLSLTINGVKYLDRIPLASFLPDLTDRDDGFFPFKSPLLWQAQTSAVTLIEFPTAITGATNNLRVQYEGYGLLS